MLRSVTIRCYSELLPGSVHWWKHFNLQVSGILRNHQSENWERSQVLLTEFLAHSISHLDVIFVTSSVYFPGLGSYGWRQRASNTERGVYNMTIRTSSSISSSLAMFYGACIFFSIPWNDVVIWNCVVQRSLTVADFFRINFCLVCVFRQRDRPNCPCDLVSPVHLSVFWLPYWAGQS